MEGAPQRRGRAGRTSPAERRVEPLACTHHSLPQASHVHDGHRRLTGIAAPSHDLGYRFFVLGLALPPTRQTLLSMFAFLALSTR